MPKVVRVVSFIFVFLEKRGRDVFVAFVTFGLFCLLLLFGLSVSWSIDIIDQGH